MADMTTLQEKQGYKIVTVTVGPQKGRKVLRVAWPEMDELRAIGRTAAKLPPPESDEYEDALVELYRLLAELIPQWDLLDRKGQPLANMEDNPRSFDKLDGLTQSWLMWGSKPSIWDDCSPNLR